jgi:hypothetical protein
MIDLNESTVRRYAECKAERAKRDEAELMRQMKISSLHQPKQNETDDMMAAPGMRSDED